MNTNPSSAQNQIEVTRRVEIFDGYFSQFKISRLMKQAGIVKTKGASPLTLFTIVFNLAFTGKNFYEGIVRNRHVEVGKDAVYAFLNSPRYNWRRLSLQLFSRIYLLITHLLDDASEEVLIIDDSPYDRSRSKKVELLSRVFDHATKKFIKGFRFLTLGWSDGNSFLGIDFALLSSAEGKNRYAEVDSRVDKRSCGFKRRQEAMTKTTELLEPMVERAIRSGVRAKYLLMDSWFSMPAVISTLRRHIDIVCMLKDQATWFYGYNGKRLRLRDLYSKLQKRRGKARVKARVQVKLPDGNSAKIIFVSCDKDRGWLALLSTDTSLPDEEIIRLYGKRWNIEVFFKMCKQHLKLVKEIQIRSYDGLIAHTSMVIARYNVLSLYQRESIDGRSFGDLFRACYDELANLTFIDALKRILQEISMVLRKTYRLPEEVLRDMIELIMGKAIAYFGLERGQVPMLAMG